VGYVQTRPDGERCGDTGENISLSHELYSIGNVVFSLHKLNPPEIETAQVKEAICEEKHLRCKFENIEGFTVDNMQKLKEFLCKISEQGWTVSLQSRFRKDLKRHGLDGNEAPVRNSG
jgi:tRNA splicing ligase